MSFSFCRSMEGTSQQLMTQLVQGQQMLQRQIQQQHQEPTAGIATIMRDCAATQAHVPART